MSLNLDEIEAQLDSTCPYYLLELVRELRQARAALPLVPRDPPPGEALAALAWIRKKLELPEDAQLTTGEHTIAGALHVMEHRANLYLYYAAEAGELKGQLAALREERDQLGQEKNALNIDGARWQSRAETAEAELAQLREALAIAERERDTAQAVIARALRLSADTPAPSETAAPAPQVAGRLDITLTEFEHRGRVLIGELQEQQPRRA